MSLRCSMRVTYKTTDCSSSSSRSWDLLLLLFIRDNIQRHKSSDRERARENIFIFVATTFTFLFSLSFAIWLEESLHSLNVSLLLLLFDCRTHRFTDTFLLSSLKMPPFPTNLMILLKVIKCARQRNSRHHCNVA
jgi:hypothetical protein